MVDLYFQIDHFQIEFPVLLAYQYLGLSVLESYLDLVVFHLLVFQDIHTVDI